MKKNTYTQTRTHAQGPCCDHCGNLHNNKSFVSLAVTVAMFMSLRYVNYNNTSVMLGRYKVGITLLRVVERRATCDNQVRLVRNLEDGSGCAVGPRLPCPRAG